MDETSNHPSKQKLIIKPLSGVVPKAVEYLPTSRLCIPLDMVTLISGDPEAGKTFIIYSLLAELTREHHYRVLIFSEDPEDTIIRPRLEVAGADIDCIHYEQGMLNRDGSEEPFLMTPHRGSFEDIIIEYHPKIVFIDPQISFSSDKDNFKPSDMRALLDPYKDLTGKHHFSLISSVHNRKELSANAKYRIAGSIQQVASARAKIYVGVYDGQRTVVQTLTTDSAPVAYSFELKGVPYPLPNKPDYKVARLEWKEELTGVTPEHLSGVSPAAASEQTSSKGDIAKAFLQGALWDQPRWAKDLDKRAEAAGINSRTLKRAKEDLGVESKQLSRDGQGAWASYLPGDEEKLGTLVSRPEDQKTKEELREMFREDMKQSGQEFLNDYYKIADEVVPDLVDEGIRRHLSKGMGLFPYEYDLA